MSAASPREVVNLIPGGFGFCVGLCEYLLALAVPLEVERRAAERNVGAPNQRRGLAQHMSASVSSCLFS